MEIIALPNFPLIEPGDDLASRTIDTARKACIDIQQGDVLVLAQKIVSKAENRYVDLGEVKPSAEALELADKTHKDPRLLQIILNESKAVIRHKPGVIIVEHNLGYVHANAGVDRSNLPSIGDSERVLLLPENPDQSAAKIRARLEDHYNVGVAVIINDSAGRAWRNGIVGFAIGTAGFEPINNMAGKTDLYGRALEVTEVAVADELAAAASHVMGQADEATPVTLIRGANVSMTESGSMSLIRDRSEDLFR